ncbi:hypothetical protein DL346_02545 [Paenibacillus montanisoli]|uniref:Uncharacterized protein n=1 Tax=Paenibacillus montanisoli TaxID=2081970 RepID=A0A328UBG8_9BACL|nr:hypothetical protein DL346_02545 [Paenibacillus montanisoli]
MQLVEEVTSFSKEISQKNNKFHITFRFVYVMDMIYLKIYMNLSSNFGSFTIPFPYAKRFHCRKEFAAFF